MSERGGAYRCDSARYYVHKAEDVGRLRYRFVLINRIVHAENHEGSVEGAVKDGRTVTGTEHSFVCHARAKRHSTLRESRREAGDEPTYTCQQHAAPRLTGKCRPVIGPVQDEACAVA
eukprot:scaffold38950_cov68-Phaeocystis_antarctica.AAC.10